MSSGAWWLVLGLLLGWLIEWVIDWLYWRRRLNVMQSELAALRVEQERVRGELQTSQNLAQQRKIELDALAAKQVEGERLQSELVSMRSASEGCQQEVATLKTTIDGLQSENVRLRSELEAPHSATLAAPVTQRDPLIDVNGIGPVYQQRLFDAGIFTFAQLAEQTPEHLHEVIHPERWQELDYAAWIAEAHQFAQQRSES